MNFNYSDRMNGLDGSATREILKLLSRPEIVSFAGGLPASEFLPKEKIAEITQEILTSDAKAALQYGSTEGFAKFRQQLITYLSDAGVQNLDLDNVLVISGGQQGIDLMIKSFINPGDVVLVEDPTYLAFLQILKSFQGKAVGVKTTEDGLDLDDLEQKIKVHNPKLLYCVPTFSNPTGKTYTTQNRKGIARITAKYNLPVLEDDPYSKLRFSGQPVPPLKSFDTADNIVYVTSFSKVLSPGLRVAVAAGNKQIIRKMVICKQGSDLHTSNLSQLITYKYLQSGEFDKNIKRSIPIYQQRLSAMTSALDKYMPSEFNRTNPEGGLFVWGWFSKPLNTVKILPEALERNAAYIQGAVFYAEEGSGLNTLRFNFSNESPERIEMGIKALGDLFKEKILQL